MEKYFLALKSNNMKKKRRKIKNERIFFFSVYRKSAVEALCFGTMTCFSLGAFFDSLLFCVQFFSVVLFSIPYFCSPLILNWEWEVKKWWWFLCSCGFTKTRIYRLFLSSFWTGMKIKKDWWSCWRNVMIFWEFFWNLEINF